MELRPVSNRLAGTSFTLGILGWVLYFLQWCFDLTIGLVLTVVTAGTSAVCSTVLDFLPFIFWLFGILTGHVALGQIKRSGGPGHRRAVWGLVLSYTGLVFSVLFVLAIVLLIAAGVGAGVLDKVIPSLHWH